MKDCLCIFEACLFWIFFWVFSMIYSKFFWCKWYYFSDSFGQGIVKIQFFIYQGKRKFRFFLKQSSLVSTKKLFTIWDDMSLMLQKVCWIYWKGICLNSIQKSEKEGICVSIRYASMLIFLKMEGYWKKLQSFLSFTWNRQVGKIKWNEYFFSVFHISLLSFQ